MCPQMAPKKKKKIRGRGRPRKPDRTQAFSLRLSEELHRNLKMLAGLREMSLNDLFNEILLNGWKAAPERRTIQRLIAKK